MRTVDFYQADDVILTNETTSFVALNTVPSRQTVQNLSNVVTTLAFSLQNARKMRLNRLELARVWGLM